MYPHGWFVVAMSGEVTQEGELATRYFEQPIRLWRDDTGNVCTDGWTTCERNGLVFVSYPKGNAAPGYEIPSLAENDSDEWEPWSLKCLEIATQSREVVENVADRGHFLPVHGTRFDSFEAEFVDHMAIQRTKGSGSEDFPLSPFESEATYYGPSFQITRLFTRNIWSLLLNTHTMIDSTKLHLWFGVKIQKSKHSQRFIDAYVTDVREGFLQDVAIWEHKKWRDNPVLCDGDGPIMKLRKWYSQFYETA